MYTAVFATVVVGKVTPLARYAPEVVVHTNVCGVPLSLIRMINFCPSTGVPLGATIVAEVERAVTSYCVTVVVGVIVVPVDVDVVEK